MEMLKAVLPLVEKYIKRNPEEYQLDHVEHVYKGLLHKGNYEEWLNGANERQAALVAAYHVAALWQDDENYLTLGATWMKYDAAKLHALGFTDDDILKAQVAIRESEWKLGRHRTLGISSIFQAVLRFIEDGTEAWA